MFTHTIAIETKVNYFGTIHASAASRVGVEVVLFEHMVSAAVQHCHWHRAYCVFVLLAFEYSTTLYCESEHRRHCQSRAKCASTVNRGIRFNQTEKEIFAN